MALTPEEELKLRSIIQAFDNGQKTTDLPEINKLNGSEFIEVIQDDISKKTSVKNIKSSESKEFTEISGIRKSIPLKRQKGDIFLITSSGKEEIYVDKNAGGKSINIIAPDGYKLDFKCSDSSHGLSLSTSSKILSGTIPADYNQHIKLTVVKLSADYTEEKFQLIKFNDDNTFENLPLKDGQRFVCKYANTTQWEYYNLSYKKGDELQLIPVVKRIERYLDYDINEFLESNKPYRAYTYCSRRSGPIMSDRPDEEGRTGRKKQCFLNEIPKVVGNRIDRKNSKSFLKAVPPSFFADNGFITRNYQWRIFTIVPKDHRLKTKKVQVTYKLNEKEDYELYEVK